MAETKDAPAGAKSGCGCAVFGVALFVLLTVGCTERTGDGRGWALVVGGALIALLAWTIGRTSHRDKETTVLRRIEALPLSADFAQDGEFLWLRGPVRCPRPLCAANVDVLGVWMLEKDTTGSGKNRRTNRTVSRIARIWAGGPADVVCPEVVLHGAEYAAVPRVVAKSGIREWHVTYLTAEGELSFVGRFEFRHREPPPEPLPPDRPSQPAPHSRTSVEDMSATEAAEGGAPVDAGISMAESAPVPVLAGTRELPLLGTPLDRASWIVHAEASAAFDGGLWRGAGTLGAACVGAGFGWLLDIPPDAPGGDYGRGAVVAFWALAAAWPCMIGGWIAARARLVSLRARAEKAAEALERELLAAAEPRGAAAAVARAEEAPSPFADPGRAAAERVAARIVVYDDLAAYFNRARAKHPVLRRGSRPDLRELPLQG